MDLTHVWEKKILFAPALTKKPIDTLGAGDAFLLSVQCCQFTQKNQKKLDF